MHRAEREDARGLLDRDEELRRAGDDDASTQHPVGRDDASAYCDERRRGDRSEANRLGHVQQRDVDDHAAEGDDKCSRRVGDAYVLAVEERARAPEHDRLRSDGRDGKQCRDAEEAAIARRRGVGRVREGERREGRERRREGRRRVGVGELEASQVGEAAAEDAREAAERRREQSHEREGNEEPYEKHRGRRDALDDDRGRVAFEARDLRSALREGGGEERVEGRAHEWRRRRKEWKRGRRWWGEERECEVRSAHLRKLGEKVGV